MKKKKLRLNLEWPDAIGTVGVVVGMLSFFIGAVACIAMHEAVKLDESSLIIFGMFIFGLTVSIVGSGYIVKASAKEMLEDITEEDEKEGEFSVVNCGAEDVCPSIDSGSACPSFGTDICPLEHQRGDI